MPEFEIGDKVIINSPGHQYDTYVGWVDWASPQDLAEFLEWDYRVAFDNDSIYGFWAHELEDANA